MENLLDYGLTRITAPYWGRQVMGVLGVVATALYLGSFLWGVAFGMRLQLFWIGASLVFAIERVVTVRRRGWRQMLLAAPLVIEMAYDIFLQFVQARAFAHAVAHKKKEW